MKRKDYSITITDPKGKTSTIEGLPNEVIKVMLSAALSYLLGNQTMRLR